MITREFRLLKMRINLVIVNSKSSKDVDASAAKEKFLLEVYLINLINTLANYKIHKSNYNISLSSS